MKMRMESGIQFYDEDPNNPCFKPFKYRVYWKGEAIVDGVKTIWVSNHYQFIKILQSWNSKDSPTWRYGVE